MKQVTQLGAFLALYQSNYMIYALSSKSIDLTPLIQNVVLLDNITKMINSSIAHSNNQTTQNQSPIPFIYKQMKIDEYLICESYLYQKSNSKNKQYIVTIPITIPNVASMLILFVLIVLGSFYIWKTLTHKQCTCKLCKGNYLIESKLGEGGYGEIYKVTHKGGKYILKRCRTENIVEADDLLCEAKHLRVLDHKNIVKYHDDFIHVEYERGKIEPVVYVITIMAYCEGGDLKDLIDRHYYDNEPFSNEEIIDILIQLCEGLNYIHHKNIIHRDIKSQNIFFTKTGVLRIGDFGLARKVKNNKRRITSMTKAGTDCYMAPEVLRSKRYNTSADIWSLGCVIEEMCTLTFAWQYEQSIGIEAMVNREYIQGYIDDISCSKYNYSFFKELLKKIFVVEPEKRESVETLLYKLKREKKKMQNWKVTKTLQECR